MSNGISFVLRCFFIMMGMLVFSQFVLAEQRINKAVMTGVKVPRGVDVVELTIVDSKGEDFLCTGTFITDRIVLTAAHCLEADIQEVGITLGGRYMRASRYLKHPKYSTDSFGALVNDVALLFFNSALRVKSTSILTSKAPLRGQRVYFYGFGLDENDTIGTLRKGKNTIYGIYNGYFSFRYTQGTSNTCEGDSGGPVLRDIRDKNNNIVRVIVGVTSSGDKQDCSYGDTSYFTSLHAKAVASFLRTNAPKARFR